MLIEQVKKEDKNFNSSYFTFVILGWFFTIFALIMIGVGIGGVINHNAKQSGALWFGCGIFYFGSLFFGISYIGYLKNLKDLSWLQNFKNIVRFKIFLNGVSFHYYGKYNSKEESNIEKATFPVNSVDISPEKQIERSCGNRIIIFKIDVDIQFADENTKIAYENISDELRKRNINKDANFLIRNEYDFIDDKEEFAIKNDYCLIFLNVWVSILFTFIIPLGFLYWIYFHCSISMTTYTIKKLVRLESSSNLESNIYSNNQYDQNSSTINLPLEKNFQMRDFSQQ